MRVGVPFYLHPAEHPDAWTALRSHRLPASFAVINVSNGPGTAPDPYYSPVLADQNTAGLAGYVDVAYGDRPAGDVLADAARWWEFYRVREVMLDRVPAVGRQGHWSLATIDRLREVGVTRVIANPGCAPHPRLIKRADVTCVVENSWERLVAGLPFPRINAPPEKLWHLMYGVPPSHYAAAVHQSAAAGAGHVFVTDASLPNPWGRLPTHAEALWHIVAEQAAS